MCHGTKLNPPGRTTALCTVAIKTVISRLQLIIHELFKRSTKLIKVINYGILMLYIKICNNKPPHLCRNMQQFICIINSVHGSAYQPLYYPTNALICIKCTVIKNIKNIKTAQTCFGSRRNHPQGANVST